ncbi:unnamed protein product [Brachionus calyciflorus]|uniref:Retropepsins domain-containing protein n=1 Tax=Brachionus calyciflorus TaxID=104777 RepID=A0A814EYP1_9BILA|nr:unnamed protein product [Brachionus calyciflorus]
MLWLLQLILNKILISIQNVNYIKTRNNDKKIIVNRNINKTTYFNKKPLEKRFMTKPDNTKYKNAWYKNKSKPKDYSHQKPTDRYLIKTEINCHRYKGKRHYANQCKVHIKMINQINISNSDSEEYEIEQIITLTYRQNHIIRSKALINGIELTVGLDSGATVSVLSHDIAVKNNIQILSSDCKVKTATINYQEFVVFDHEDNDVLLGLDWFCKIDCGIYPYKAMLSFPEEKNYLKKYIKELDSDDTADMFLSELNVDKVELEEENYWDMSDIKLEPASKLNPKELIHFDKLKYSASKIFANENELSACSIMEHKIRIESDNQLPLYTSPYRKSKTERDFV